MLVLFIYITRLASNEIFSPSNKIHREVGPAKDLSASLKVCAFNRHVSYVVILNTSLSWDIGICQGSFIIPVLSGESVLMLLELVQNIYAINMTWHETYLPL